MSDLLDPSALLHVLQQQLLPSTSSSSSSSEPLLRNPSDALAAMIHTIMTRLDFRLTGLSEEDRLPPSQDDSASSTSNTLPETWNAKGPDHYCFRYKHHQSSLDFLIKIIKLGNKAVIHGVALQGTKTSTMEVVLSDFLSTAFWPYPHAQGGDTEPLVNGYIGSSRLKDLVSAFKAQILQQLVPGLRKDGYVEEEGSSRSGNSGSSSQPSRPNNPSGGAQPRSPFGGNPDDPSYPSNYPQQPPFRNPLIIGDRDLDPLGGSPLAMPPRFGGGNGGFAPPPLFPGGDTGGGMFVGPNHPMFRDRFPTNTGLPPGAVPPGARFDPIYPAGTGPFHPENPDVGGARPQNFPYGSGEPDWDELAPPRGENAFPGRGGRGGGRGGGAGGRHPDTSGWYA
ncbi:hypothetical protein EX895_005500 [Sporisorium graminicola]|uniref:Uncharacterized protein n=1 Tax=Sporisorium graminicola TaxID=280036 RepID=A0A4U7KQ82_9BASI|nr:hypothetical protein EX895_005500 [Sporisorium graminicola]TKY85338.1 hypothetical protein EX895_005500 [Sporisorium graminicola]